MRKHTTLSLINGHYLETANGHVRNTRFNRDILEQNALDSLTAWSYNFDECVDTVELVTINTLLHFMIDYDETPTVETIKKYFYI